MAKPKAISLHIGVNRLDPKHYAGWKGELQSCENDADDLAAVAKAMGFKTKVLHTSAATREAVLKAVVEARKTLKAGDFFLLTYSGHGGQVLDVSGDELDLMDECWCLHDAQVIDDELQVEITHFAKGSRVFVISDSSPSGSVLRPYMPEPDPPPPGQRARIVPPVLAEKIYRQNAKFYDGLQMAQGKRGAPGDGPAVIVFHGCQHNQAAIDGKENGVFTQRILRVWNLGSYQGNYVRFFAHIVTRMPATQTPMMRTHGLVSDFVLEQPFKP